MFTVIASGLSFPGSNGAHYRNILDEGNRQKRGENSHEILFFDGVPQCTDVGNYVTYWTNCPAAAAAHAPVTANALILTP